MGYQDIIDFWFTECQPSDWLSRSDDFDELIKRRFLNIHHQACAGETYTWRTSIDGRLAEILVLDQFSRHIFRNSPNAYAQDAQALVLAQEAVAQGIDQKLEYAERTFIYMPYMHSESLLIHETAESLFKTLSKENHYSYELKHKAIIEKFGRYPQRNQLLKRDSTKSELLFLKQAETEG